MFITASNIIKSFLLFHVGVCEKYCSVKIRAQGPYKRISAAVRNSQVWHASPHLDITLWSLYILSRVTVTKTPFELVIGFIELLQNVTTINYSANANSHSAVHYSMYEIFSVCCIFTGCPLVTASNAVASSASVFTSLLAGNCLTTYSMLQLTNSQAGGHLTPTSFLFWLSRNRSCSSTRTAEETPLPTIPPLLRAHLFRQLPSNGCCIYAYFTVVAEQRVYMPQCVLKIPQFCPLFKNTWNFEIPDIFFSNPYPPYQMSWKLSNISSCTCIPKIPGSNVGRVSTSILGKGKR
jgi:hypothetical protein